MEARSRGYSLYELLVTLTIASVVLGLGIPSFGKLISHSRQVAEINALFHVIHQARKASITRQSYLTICPSEDGRQCRAGRDWSPGWILFVNTDRDNPARVDAGEIVLKQHIVHPTIRLTANRQSFTLRATRRRATNGTLVACDRAGRSEPRALVISYTGRPRAAQRTPRGRRYSCAD